MEHHSMSAGEFKDRYGVTPQEVQDALDENRRRVARKLSEWGYGWAVDEVMCDVAVELLKGGLRRWASYEDRKALGAFVNTLLGNRLGEWMRTERPKYRGGMTHAPQTRRKRSAHTSSQGESLDADEARSLIRRRIMRHRRDACVRRTTCSAIRIPMFSPLPRATGPAIRNGLPAETSHRAGERRIQGRHEIPGKRMRATGSGWSDIVADAGTPMPHRDTWRRRIAR